MKYKFILAVLISLFLQIGCNKEPFITESGLYSVSGKIYNSKGSVQNAKITIDNSVNWTAYTSEEGSFMIENVPEGTHKIEIEKENPDKSFSEKSETISVYTNLILDSLFLPKPVKLFEPYDITVHSLKLDWESTDAEDFIEYKLYKRDTPGLDETTGELIYVSTNKMDTTFEDTGLYSNNIYYYRAYVMNNYGRLGGSNIVSSTTLQGNLIINGDFESTINILDDWDILGSGNVTLDSIVFYQGSKSLHIETPFRSTGNSTSLFSKEPIFIEPNVQHVLAGWFKFEGRVTDLINAVVVIKQGQQQLMENLMFAEGGGIGNVYNQDWIYKNISFSVSNNEPIKLWIYCTTENIWIDELSIISQ